MDYALPVSQLTVSVLQVFFHYTLKVYRYTITIVYNTGGCGITQRGERNVWRRVWLFFSCAKYL